MKTKSINKNQWHRKKKNTALCKHTALDKVANSINKASVNAALHTITFNRQTIMID